MIAVIDYGAGNLFSVKNALEYLKQPYLITNDIDQIRKADGYILPGVGAFPFAMKQLTATGLVEEIKKQVQTKPLLGICLGMQMLFEESTEFELTKGLGLIPGRVDHLVAPGQKIPHLGWNQLEIEQPENPLLQGMHPKDCVYFVHSYMAFTPKEYIAAWCDYGGVQVPALTVKDNVYGCQFHPEKSGETGLGILTNFCQLCQGKEETSC